MLAAKVPLIRSISCFSYYTATQHHHRPQRPKNVSVPAKYDNPQIPMAWARCQGPMTIQQTHKNCILTHYTISQQNTVVPSERILIRRRRRRRRFFATMHIGLRTSINFGCQNPILLFVRHGFGFLAFVLISGLFWSFMRHTSGGISNHRL
jgi:hypothetical protein